VDPRTTSRDGSITGSRACGLAPQITASRLRTAVSPIACSGAATVASAGVTSSPAYTLSNPTTLTSRGTATVESDVWELPVAPTHSSSHSSAVISSRKAHGSATSVTSSPPGSTS
jgi:hypothetical protein